MLAAKNNINIEVIQYLCETFKDTIDIDKKDNNGYTAFMLAAKYNKNENVIRYLYDIF